MKRDEHQPPRRLLSRLLDWVEAERLRGRSVAELACLGAAIYACAYVCVYPFLLARYPPMTDLPMHAAMTSIVRHYWNPAFHFHEQFTLHPVEVPYMSMYGLGALVALVVPITWATKLMAISMLLLIPAGLGVLFWGMKKNPLLGLLGLGLVWTKLSHWGWLNFAGSLGLYAASIGFALALLDRPSWRRALLLGGTLWAIFFTHVYRLPFAVLAVLGTTVVMYPATRRYRPVILPVGSVLGLFFLWWFIRPAALSADVGPLALHWERFAEPLLPRVYSGYKGPVGDREISTAASMVWVFVAIAAAGAVWALKNKRVADDDRRSWSVGVTIVPAVLFLGHLLTFAVLPMRIGEWWHVYPRELEAAFLFVLASTPTLPRRWTASLALVAVIGVSTGRMGYLVAEQYRGFQRSVRGFVEIRRHIPIAPKLLYMVLHGGGTSKRDSPWVHLPAWVQAEKGGWLSFHFAGWGTSPVRYRKDGDVPPPFGRDWEWTPARFMVHRDWFDWFLVRSKRAPDRMFAADRSIRRVADADGWWLYRRDPKSSAP